LPDFNLAKLKNYVRNNVSKYALKNIGKEDYSELFAEAFSEYLNRGDKARDFAKLVGKAVEPYINGMIK
jgi:hypothetical protein